MGVNIYLSFQIHKMKRNKKLSLEDGMNPLAFGERNYQIMIVGIILILSGFIIIALDKEEFGFGFLGLTLGPIIVMGGFLIEFFAILYNPYKRK